VPAVVVASGARDVSIASVWPLLTVKVSSLPSTVAVSSVEPAAAAGSTIWT